MHNDNSGIVAMELLSPVIHRFHNTHNEIMIQLASGHEFAWHFYNWAGLLRGANNNLLNHPYTEIKELANAALEIGRYTLDSSIKKQVFADLHSNNIMTRNNQLVIIDPYGSDGTYYENSHPGN